MLQHRTTQGQVQTTLQFQAFQTPNRQWWLSSAIHKGKACLYTQCLNRAHLETATFSR